MRTGELGFWWRSLGGPPPLRAPLEGPLEVDVAIVGAGYTGLWTAYYLKRSDPSLRIAIVEAQRSGFGASGRNGGWLTSSFSGPARAYERARGAGAYAALQRAMFETVDEVAGVLAREQIEADLVKGGHLSVALDGAQAEHLREHLREMRALGVAEADLRELRAEQLGERARIAGARAAISRLTPRAYIRQSWSPGWRGGRAARCDDLRADARARDSRTPPARTEATCERAGSCARPRATRTRCAACAASWRRSTAR